MAPSCAHAANLLTSALHLQLSIGTSPPDYAYLTVGTVTSSNVRLIAEGYTRNGLQLEEAPLSGSPNVTAEHDALNSEEM